MNIKQISVLIISLILSREVLAGPMMVVLEYHQPDSRISETSRFADRLREEFRRRYGPAVLNTDETRSFVSYYKEGVLKSGKEVSSELLEESKKAYFQLQLTEAETNLQKLVKKEFELAKVEGYLVLGLTHFAQNREKEAQKDFAETLRLDPSRILDPRFFPPKVVRFFNHVRDQQEKSDLELRVEADPQGSEVWINGVFKGLTPLSLNGFPVGTHYIRVRANHFHDFVKEVDLKETESVVLRPALMWDYQKKENFIGFSSKEVGGEEGITPVSSALGRELGASQVVLVSLEHQKGKSIIHTQLVDVNLQTSFKDDSFDVENIEERSAELASQVADTMAPKLADSLQEHPEKYAANRYQGDIILIGHHRKPFYKKPLFWGLVVASGVSGGIAAALAGGSAATGAVGILFQ